MLDKHRERSLNDYIKAMKTAEECVGFSDGYEQAFKDFCVLEMLVMLGNIVHHVGNMEMNDEQEEFVAPLIAAAEELLQKITET